MIQTEHSRADMRERNNFCPMRLHGFQTSAFTSITFTPVNGTLFGGFSFRGQMKEAGDIVVTVQNIDGQLYDFTFSIDKANQDFSRLFIEGIDGQTIKSVKLESDGFKSVKQIQFNYAAQAASVPEPSLMLLLGIGIVAVSLSAWRFRN